MSLLVPYGLSLGLALLNAYNFRQKTLMASLIPGVSIAALALLLQVHAYGLLAETMTVKSQCLSAWVFWNLDGRLQDPITLAFCMSVNLVSHGQKPKSAASWVSRWTPCDHGCRGLWKPDWLNSKIYILRQLCMSRLAWGSLLKANFFKSFPFYTLEPG